MDKHLQAKEDNDLSLGVGGDCSTRVYSRPRREIIIPCDDGSNVEDIDYKGVNVDLLLPKLDADISTVNINSSDINIDSSDINLKGDKTLSAFFADKIRLNKLDIQIIDGEIHVFSKSHPVFFHGSLN